MIQKIICFNLFIQICSFPPIMSNLTTKHRPTEQNGHQQTFWTQIVLLSEDIVNVRAYDLSQQDWTLSPPVITWFLLIELFPPLSLSEVGWWRNSGEMFGQAGGRRGVWGLRWAQVRRFRGEKDLPRLEHQGFSSFAFSISSPVMVRALHGIGFFFSKIMLYKLIIDCR